jgi:site-specific recombinase XerD
MFLSPERNMFLSKRSNGIYYLWYNDGTGIRRKVSTGSKLKSVATAFLRDFSPEGSIVIHSSANITFQSFVEMHLEYAKATFARRTVMIYEMAFANLQVLIGPCLLQKLNARNLDEYKVHRLQKVSPVTLNIEMRSLKASMNLAVKWGLLGTNPFAEIGPVRISESSPAYFSKAEFKKLFSTISEPWLKKIALFALVTGMRRAEITNLRWEDVRLDQRMIIVHSSSTFKTKTGKQRAIPLNDIAFQILWKEHEATVSEYVFSLNGTKVYDDWVTHKFGNYVRSCGINQELHFHSLRHTFATWLVQDGVSIYEIQKLLGHSSIAVTQIYSHLGPSQLLKTVNRITIDLGAELLGGADLATSTLPESYTSGGKGKV